MAMQQEDYLEDRRVLKVTMTCKGSPEQPTKRCSCGGVLEYKKLGTPNPGWRARWNKQEALVSELWGYKCSDCSVELLLSEVAQELRDLIKQASDQAE